MPQFSPYWYINTISWILSLLSLLIFIHQSITFPSIISLQLSRYLLTVNN